MSSSTKSIWITGIAGPVLAWLAACRDEGWKRAGGWSPGRRRRRCRYNRRSRRRRDGARDIGWWSGGVSRRPVPLVGSRGRSPVLVRESHANMETTRRWSAT